MTQDGTNYNTSNLFGAEDHLRANSRLVLYIWALFHVALESCRSSPRHGEPAAVDHMSLLP